MHTMDKQNKPSTPDRSDSSFDSLAKETQKPIFQDFMLQENLAHFVRERIPERVVSAKGSGAYGVFKVTGDISSYTNAQVFSSVGNTCRIFVRFSMEASDKGGVDSKRDLRGFAIKFYTEAGNWDLVGHNSPVFFIRDAKKFPHLMRAQRRHPQTNLKSHAMMWDFWSHNPESLHQVLMMFSDRGIPNGYRHMHGYGANTYAMINKEGGRVWVKFHLKTQQGIDNLSNVEAKELAAKDPDFAQEDMVEAIRRKQFPKWKLYIQVMTEEQAKEFRWNPFDVTKVWFHEEFPLMEVGEMELNEIPSNYFSHVEQAVFSPSNLVEGISLSPDRILQGRLFTYPDAQRYRVGVNANQLEVNRSAATEENFMEGEQTSQSDRLMPLAAQEGQNAAIFAGNENDDDHYTQPGLFFTKALDDQGRQCLVQNIINHMQRIEEPRKNEIINRQLCHFFRANIELGLKVASGLHIDIDANMMSHAK